MTELSNKPFPKDPNAAGPQPGTDLRPDPHAPDVPPGIERALDLAQRMRAAYRLVVVIANTLKAGERRRDGGFYQPGRSEESAILGQLIDSARTIVGSGQEGVK